MSFDSDVALLGTGIAPLIAANRLLLQGKSVLLLNPDRDFFLEDSELPLDPLLQTIPDPQRLALSSPEHALSVLRPDFPGAIEFWSPNSEYSGFHDITAPHVRQRSRLWISSRDKTSLWKWAELEDLYVEASDAGLKPQIFEGLLAARKFPGFAAQTGEFRGLIIPKLCDVDIVRYRNGLLEFVRERLRPDRMVSAVSQLEWMPEGIRFHSKGSVHNAKLREGMLVFWTPRLTSWIMAQAKRTETKPKLPTGVRLWEQWLLHSREAPNSSVVGMFGDMAVWADVEGIPSNRQAPPPQLSVLRTGPLVPLQGIHLPQGGLSWASEESFGALSQLCHGFLKWDRFSISALKARAIFEWNNEESWKLANTGLRIWIIPACDGPLVNVVKVARAASDRLIQET